MEQEKPRQCVKCGKNVNIERTARLPCGDHICDSCKQNFLNQHQKNRIECICEKSHNRKTIEIRNNITIKQNGKIQHFPAHF